MDNHLFTFVFFTAWRSYVADKSVTEVTGQRRPLSRSLTMWKQLVAWVGEMLVLVGMKLQESQQLNHHLPVR
jgi:hypothetical protein